MLSLGDEIGLMRGWWEPQQLNNHTWQRTIELRSGEAQLLDRFHHLVWTDDFSRLQQLGESQSLQLMINQQNQSGQSAIHMAQSPHMLQFLLDQGADPSMANHFGDTVLLHMVQRNRYEMVKILLQYGADPRQANSFGESPISEASWRKHHAIDELLRHYSDGSTR